MDVQRAAGIVEGKAIALAEGSDVPIGAEQLALLFAGTDVTAAPVIEWLREQARVVSAGRDLGEDGEQFLADLLAHGVIVSLVGVHVARRR
jgi:hypothetical protein